MGIRQWIGEVWPVPYIPRSLIKTGTALRGVFSEAWYGAAQLQKTHVDYLLARSLYRNDNPAYSLGAGFVRPIVDLSVEYMALPQISGSTSEITTYLNECIHEFWAAHINEVYRDSLRDSKTVFRFRQPNILNPLVTESDRMHGRIESVPPELVEFTFDPSDPEMVEKCVVHHEILFDTRSTTEITEGRLPSFEAHHILEIITPEKYEFWDATDNRQLESWGGSNKFKFVPLWPAYNEYSADLGGGQSDIEPVLPFITAFHDVLLQTLAAHKYHSTPKAMFNLKSVESFIANNFPEVLDSETKRVKPGAKINWSGREVLFFESEENGGFIEARSVLGDSKTLLEFLIDCIAIAGEVPRWALLKDQGATEKDATVHPFDKKIHRKRVNYTPTIQMMCKMALVAKNIAPETVKVIWPAIRLNDLAAKGQAIQQIVMALDTAKINHWVADDTVIEILAGLFPEINDPATEKKLAQDNFEPPVIAPAPASPTQGNQAPKNGNGNGSKSTATKVVKQLTTSKPSNS